MYFQGVLIRNYAVLSHRKLASNQGLMMTAILLINILLPSRTIGNSLVLRIVHIFFALPCDNFEINKIKLSIELPIQLMYNYAF